MALGNESGWLWSGMNAVRSQDGAGAAESRVRVSIRRVLPYGDRTSYRREGAGEGAEERTWRGRPSENSKCTAPGA